MNHEYLLSSYNGIPISNICARKEFCEDKETRHPFRDGNNKYR